MNKNNPDPTQSRYFDGQYLQSNPTWDIEDSPWKVKQIMRVLQRNKLEPKTVTEVGCGAGAILAGLNKHLEGTKMTGYDIAPSAQKFWLNYSDTDVEYILGDFFLYEKQRYDVLLMLDVLEHTSNPFDFLFKLQGYADHYIFHIPLDLSVMSVLREKPLINVRTKVGHIHYYTKGIALALLEESGYEVIDSFFTGAGISGPIQRFRTRLAILPRYFCNLLSRDLSARIMGGETLMVLARDSSH